MTEPVKITSGRRRKGGREEGGKGEERRGRGQTKIHGGKGKGAGEGLTDRGDTRKWINRKGKEGNRRGFLGTAGMEGRGKGTNAAIKEAKKQKLKWKSITISRVRDTSCQAGDMVYSKTTTLVTPGEMVAKLGPEWEGQYEVAESLGKGEYMLKDCKGNETSRGT
ncbi:hypothetical protein Tco_1090187 [Tanacetum coccineum]|uniref:Uncharacterized protein n=1 Tax=Tanacetum coccineum TaxID=301880 RepID=A0ABQ5I4F0_9ASTR